MDIKYKRTSVFIFLFFLCLLGGLYSVPDTAFRENRNLILSDSIFYSQEKSETIGGNFLLYFADTTGDMGMDEVSSLAFSNKFLPVPVDSRGLVIDSLIKKTKVFWLKLNLINKSAVTGEWWFNCGSGKETVAFIPGQNGYLKKKSGFLVPLRDRDIKIGEENIISVFLPRDSLVSIFFRKEYDAESVISLVNLVDKNALLEEDRQDRYIQGAFFGLLIIIAIYNLLLYFFVREKSNIYYACYLLCITLSYLSASGYGFELFWPDFPGNYIWIITIGWASSGFFYVLFGREYLHAQQYLPRWNKILNIHIIGSIIAVLFIGAGIFYLNYHGLIGGNSVSIDAGSGIAGIIAALGIALTVVWIFFAFFIVLIPAYFCYRRNFQPAKYFLYASISLALGIVIQIFGDSENIFTENAFQFGMAIQAVFFSLGLGYRINLLQQEKQIAQEKALEVLEQKVQERTFELVRQKEIVEDKQKEIIDSITYAKRLQEAILPPRDFIKKYFPESFVLYLPKDIVAGDFYWMESIPKISDSEREMIFIAAADCTGHGVPGAMVSVVCSNALNRAVKEFGIRDTGKILDKVTDLVLETFSAYDKSDANIKNSSQDVKDGMDISLLSLEFDVNEDKNNPLTPGTRQIKKICWSGANNPLWYIRETDKENKNGIVAGVVEIKADKQPVGKFHLRKPFTTHIIPVAHSNLNLYLFSDGFPDQFGGPKKKKFMYKRLEESLNSMYNLPLEEQEKKLLKIFKEWKGSIEQLDDITMIGIRV